jgi:glycosyltransferase involved in cell wall biosynthesis
MSSRRFLFVIHYPVFGGPHNQALRLAEPLAANGWETIVVLPDEPGNAVGRLRGAGVDVVQIPLRRLRAVADPRVQLRFLTSIRGDVERIRGLIRTLQPSLVVIGGLVNPQAAVAARLEGVPVVWQLLDTRAPMALRLTLMPLVRGLAEVVMTNGYGVAEAQPGAVAFGDRLFPFFSPVDLELFRPDERRRAYARTELGIAPGELVIGTVGNLTPMKDHGTFLRAAREVLRAFANVRFVILGASYAYREDYTAGLWRQAEQLGLTRGNRLIIRDPGARVADLAPALDVFWLTSERRSEGTSTAVGEAMALALPVVATNVGALGETILEDKTGFLVPPGSPEQLATRTYRLLEDESLRVRMGAAARERAAQLFGLDACLEIHLRAFGRAT